jgi:hypothetical protein
MKKLFLLTLLAPCLFLLGQDVVKTLSPGSVLTLNAVAEDGAAPITFKWFHDGEAVATMSSDTLTSPPFIVAPVTTLHAGIYTVKASNDGGTTDSLNKAVVTVLVPPLPLIIEQGLENVTVPNQTPNVTMRIITSGGTAPFSYVWTKNGNILAGQNFPSYTITKVNPSYTGVYEATVTDSVKQSASSSAKLTVSTKGEDSRKSYKAPKAK